MATRATDNPFPSVLFVETEAADLADNPATGQRRLIVDPSDHLLYLVDTAGTPTVVGASSGMSDPMTTRGDMIVRNASNVTARLGRGSAGQVLTSDGTDVAWAAAAGGGAMATDALWDTAGDLAVGTGANTAAKLVIGNAGAVLARINGAVAWNAGTSFPTAATGDRYFRTDRGIEYYYDGTRWLSTTLYIQPLDNSNTVTQPLTASTVIVHHAALNYDYDQWLIDVHYSVHVTAANSGNTGSHYWTMHMVNEAGTTVLDVTTAAVTVATWTKIKGTISALAGTSHVELQVQANKTGTPGDLYHFGLLTYRLVG